ncbi:hypothetical protein D3C84_629390 [compost metagenome]
MQWDVQQRLPDVAAESPCQNDLTGKQFVGLAEEGDNSQRCQCHGPTHQKSYQALQVIVLLCIDAAPCIGRNRCKHSKRCAYSIIELYRTRLVVNQY